MLRQLLVSAALVASVGAAQAVTNPTAVLTGPDVFTEYTGVGTIGNNNVNINNNLFWFYEGSFDYMGNQVDSWFVFFDPVLDLVEGDVIFADNIVAMFDTQASLIATAAYQKAGVSYDYSNEFVGLEAPNQALTSISGNVLSLLWVAYDPGDHIRIFTSPVPEPETYALMLAGLAAVGAVARRRKA